MEFEIYNVDTNGLKQLAENIARCLTGKEIFILQGNLGAGKTTFTKFLVSTIDKELEKEVNSPTFSIMNVYETNKFNIYHIDLYRVKEFDFREILGNGVILIEWGELSDLGETELPIISIHFRITDNDIEKRDIKITIKNSKELINCFSSYSIINAINL